MNRAGAFRIPASTAAWLSLLALPGVLWAAGDLIWPVDTEPALTASFGEYRDNHFHSGVDMKTWGRVGDPCRAVGDGWVTRIKTSPVGYGRALYLKLDDGRTAVYAHLSRFGEAVEELVHHAQLQQHRYAVELFLDNDAQIRYREGEMVGYAGQSGTGHPHLHFELRDPAEQPLNPLLEGIAVPDHSPPIPTGLALSPLDALSSVENDPQPRLYDRLSQAHSGVWSAGDPIGVHGRVGVAVEAYDKADAAENQIAAAWVELRVNGTLRWTTRFDKLNLLETRKINLERDYRLLTRDWGVYHRLYRAPGNDLPMCRGEGILDTDGADRLPLELEVVMGDIAGNESRIAVTLVDDRLLDENRLSGGKPMVGLSFNHNLLGAGGRIQLTILGNYLRLAAPQGIAGFQLSGEENAVLSPQPAGGGVVAAWTLPAKPVTPLTINLLNAAGQVVDSRRLKLQMLIPGKPCRALSDDETLEINSASESLYDTAWVVISPEDAISVPGEVEAVYRLEPRDQPLAGELNIVIRIPENIRDQPGWGVYNFTGNKGWKFLGDDRRKDNLSASAREWGTFGLVRDTVPPVISGASLGEGDTVSATPRFAFSLADNMAGIKMDGIQMALDSELMPAEYDAPRARLIFQPWWKLDGGGHVLKVTAADKIGNKSERIIHFTVRSR